jgi:hypothetical protein
METEKTFIYKCLTYNRICAGFGVSRLCELLFRVIFWYIPMFQKDILPPTSGLIESGGSTFLRNGGMQPEDYTAQQPRPLYHFINP